MEASRGLAERTLRNGTDVESRVRFLFKTATSREPDATELKEIAALYTDHRARFEDEKAAQALINVGETRPDATLNPRELAAWTMVANLMLNLDETVCRN